MKVQEQELGNTGTTSNLKIADEVWIATALLHRERPESLDFSVEEIVERARREGLQVPLRRGVYVHAIQHCVANRPPTPARYRILLETRPGYRRLFRPGDTYDVRREGSKTTPRREDLPHAYRGLLAWYQDWTAMKTASAINGDPLLALQGSGRQLWHDEHADDYVKRLREGWA